MGLLNSVDDYVKKLLWDKDLSSAGRFSAAIVKFLRLSYLVIQELMQDELPMRAKSLVYTTLLSIVPMLAVSFSVLKAFGVHTRFEIFLYYFLEPLGDKGVELSMSIISFVENVKISVLGSIGMAMLIYTVMSTIQRIEAALNYIWNVEGTRNFQRRFSNYLSVLLIGPVLIFSAVSLTTSLVKNVWFSRLASIPPLGVLLYVAGKVIPYLLVCGAFTFLYMFLTNARVRFRSALVGGLYAGMIWVLTGWLFATFTVSSAQYSAIYSGFAVVILSLIWLYMNFFVLMVGARIAYYHQHPRLLAVREQGMTLSVRDLQRLALYVMSMIAGNFFYGRKPWKLDSLSQKSGMPVERLKETIAALASGGLILEDSEDPPAYLPARDLEKITIVEIINSVSSSGKDALSSEQFSFPLPVVDTIMQKIDKGIASSLDNKTLRDIAAEMKEI